MSQIASAETSSQIRGTLGTLTDQANPASFRTGCNPINIVSLKLPVMSDENLKKNNRRHLRLVDVKYRNDFVRVIRMKKKRHNVKIK